MPKEIFPSSFVCDCGHQSDFFENTIREMKAMSQKKKVYLADSAPEEHTISNRAASSKYTLFGMLVGCKPPRWLESMVPERANSVYGIYALTWELTSTEKGLSRAECFFSLKGLCIW